LAKPKSRFFRFFGYIASIVCFLPVIVTSEEPSQNEDKYEQIAITPALSAAESVSICSSSMSDLKVKAGYFFFASPKMRDVYKRGGADVQLSGAWGFSEWLRLYGSFEYLQRSGHSISGDVSMLIQNQTTTFWEIPLSLGLQARFTMHSYKDSCRKISGYFTLGPRYFFAHVHNDSDYVDRTMNENGLGGFFNMGIAADLTSHWVMDLFGEGSYCRLHFPSSHDDVQGHTMQVGGITFGGGFGYIF